VACVNGGGGAEDFEFVKMLRVASGSAVRSRVFKRKENEHDKTCAQSPEEKSIQW
jgi:hypothetical protein